MLNSKHCNCSSLLAGGFSESNLSQELLDLNVGQEERGLPSRSRSVHMCNTGVCGWMGIRVSDKNICEHCRVRALKGQFRVKMHVLIIQSSFSSKE